MAARLLRPARVAALVVALLGTPGVAHAVPAGKVVFSAEPATSTDIDGGYGYVAWTLQRPGQPWEIHWRRADGSLAEYAFARGVRVRHVQVVRIVPPGAQRSITRILAGGCARDRCRVYAIDPQSAAISQPRWASTIYGKPADGPFYVRGLRPRYYDSPSWMPDEWCPPMQVRRIDGRGGWSLPAPARDPAESTSDAPQCMGVREWAFRDLRLAITYEYQNNGSNWDTPWMVSLVHGLPASWARLPDTAFGYSETGSLTLGIAWLDGSLVSATAGERMSAETDAYRSPAAAFTVPGINPYRVSQWVPRLSRRQLVATSMVSDGTDLFLAVNGDRGVNGEYGEEIPRGLGIRENRVIIERVPPPKWQATPRS